MQNTSVTINITIAPADQTNPIVVDASGVPTSGKVGQPFEGALKVSGGTAPYSFSLAGGALPDGVSLNSDGSFDGTPTVAGAFTVTVAVSDSSV